MLQFNNKLQILKFIKKLQMLHFINNLQMLQFINKLHLHTYICKFLGRKSVCMINHADRDILCEQYPVSKKLY